MPAAIIVPVTGSIGIFFLVFLFNFPPTLVLSQAFVFAWCQLALIYQVFISALASSSKAFIH
jgi:hypothetical protein